MLGFLFPRKRGFATHITASHTKILINFIGKNVNTSLFGMKRGSTYWASIAAMETVGTKGFATIGMFHRIFDHIVTNHTNEIMRHFLDEQIGVHL